MEVIVNKNRSINISTYYYECNMIKELFNMNLITLDEYSKIIDIISDIYKDCLYNA